MMKKFLVDGTRDSKSTDLIHDFKLNCLLIDI